MVRTPMIPSKLVLESGISFSGFSPENQRGTFPGEVVFSTGMTGYVESLTDPSYAGQILVFTFPLIGNYGVPGKAFWESERIQANGIVVGNVFAHSIRHWNEQYPFLQWIAKERIPLITGVDTRAVTKHLRTKGTSPGMISSEESPKLDFSSIPNSPVDTVSCKTRIVTGKGKKRIVAVDCGMKENILRRLSRYPIEIIRVPYNEDYSKESFDGIFLSNGPGDPARVQQTISILRKALKKQKPTFGICLGAQLLALAIGAKTYKLKFGHRGQNHPCLDLKENCAVLTSQNHGYAIRPDSLPQDWEPTFLSLNDRSIEGIAHKSLPFFAVQFHPESSPGPTDASYLFEKFYSML